MRRMSSRRRGTGTAALVVSATMMLGLVGCTAGGSGTAPDGGHAAVEEPGAGGDAATDDRSVVIEGTMQIVVADAAKASSDAAAAVVSAGGRIDGREESDAGDSGRASTATMVLRIPAEKLDTTLDRLRGLGRVESLQTSTKDVTTTVRDLDARISGLTSTIARLTSFQGAASSVTDLLEIEKEITTRQTELEELRTQQAALSERVAFSTITLTLQEKASPTVMPDSFWSGLGAGWNALVVFFGALLVVLGVALPWLLLAALVAAVVVVLVRLARRRKAARHAGEARTVAGTIAPPVGPDLAPASASTAPSPLSGGTTAPPR